MDPTKTPTCCGCGQKPAACFHRAGLGVFFVDRTTGKNCHDPDAHCYLCNDCCGHSGEEGNCYRVSDGKPMSEVLDDMDGDVVLY